MKKDFSFCSHNMFPFGICRISFVQGVRSAMLWSQWALCQGVFIVMPLAFQAGGHGAQPLSLREAPDFHDRLSGGFGESYEALGVGRLGV